MSLAQVLYPSPTERGMEEWFLAHDRHHEAIIDAVKIGRGIILEYNPLYPVNEADLENWLELHQQMHSDMTSLFGIAGTDLTGLDLRNKETSDAWFFQHFLQHQAVAQATGLPI